MNCTTCKKEAETVSVVISGVYHSNICRSCILSSSSEGISSGAQSYDRRRTWEDNAQDTVQPYDAGGNPRVEFFRLYPSAAEKTFTKAELEQVKRQL